MTTPSLATLTEPIDMKKAKVAADEPMYCARVANAPRGPGPALHVSKTLIASAMRSYRRMENEPCRCQLNSYVR